MTGPDDSSPRPRSDGPEESDVIAGLRQLQQWRQQIADAGTDARPNIDMDRVQLGGTDEPVDADEPAVTSPAPVPPQPAQPPQPALTSPQAVTSTGAWDGVTRLADKLSHVFALQRDEAMVVTDHGQRRWLVPETLLVLGVSLGASGVWSILSLLNSLTMKVSLNQQTVSINPSATPDRPWLDLLNQLARVGLTVIPAVLALFLLARLTRPAAGPLRVMGIARQHIGRDVALGCAMAAGIGIPGLGLYFLARALNMNVNIAAGTLAPYWWAIPAYVLLAAMNGVLEEVVMVGYLFTRWTQRGLGPWAVICVSAAIRGSYHLYQGFGGFIGNFVMGVVFGWIFLRTKRVMPLVIAHTLLDAVSFIGYALLVGHWALLR